MAFNWHYSVNTPQVPVPLAADAVVARGDGVAVNASGYATKIPGGSTVTFAGFAVDNADNTGGSNGDKVVYVHPEGIIEASVPATAQNTLFQTVFLSDATTFTLTPTDTTACGVITEYLGGTTVRLAIQTAFHKQI